MEKQRQRVSLQTLQARASQLQHLCWCHSRRASVQVLSSVHAMLQGQQQQQQPMAGRGQASSRHDQQQQQLGSMCVEGPLACWLAQVLAFMLVVLACVLVALLIALPLLGTAVAAHMLREQQRQQVQVVGKATELHAPLLPLV